VTGWLHATAIINAAITRFMFHLVCPTLALHRLIHLAGVASGCTRWPFLFLLRT
jgi:hypothetical protein